MNTDQRGKGGVEVVRYLGERLRNRHDREAARGIRSIGKSVNEKKEVKMIMVDANDVMRRKVGLAKKTELFTRYRREEAGPWGGAAAIRRRMCDRPK